MRALTLCIALSAIASAACTDEDDAGDGAHREGEVDASAQTMCAEEERETINAEVEPACLPKVPTPVPDGRQCRSDLFVVDVPIQMPFDPATHETLTADVQAQLDAWLNAPFAGQTVRDAWFDPADCGGGVQVRRDDVFAGTSLEDGRHQRFWFCCDVGPAQCGEPSPRRVPVLPEAQCDVVAKIRALLGQPGAGDDFYVARDCDARGQGVDDWHLEALNVPIPADPADGDGVTVAVVDSIGDHGEDVAALVSAVAPAAQVVQYLGFDDPRGGPTTDLASTLGAVVDLHPSDERLVVNLSLGWPPEMGQRFTLGGGLSTVEEGASCSVQEGPAGEAVRSALAELAVRPDTIAVAAAGNRPSPMHPGVYANHAQGAPACPANTAGDGGDLFYPAAWSKVHTCTASGSLGGDPLTVAVGASGPLGVPPATTRKPVDVVAPGRTVRLPFSGSLSSGSSWATALASGIAAATLSLNRGDLLARACTDPDGVRHLERSAAGVCPAPSNFPLPNAPPCGPGCGVQGSALGGWQSQSSDHTYGPDKFAQGLGAPQPDFPICPEDDCLVGINANVDEMIFYARLDPAISNPAYTPGGPFSRLEDVELVIDHGGTRYSVALSPSGGGKDWEGGVDYKFGPFALPTPLQQPSALQKADFRIEARLIDGKGKVSDRSDPLSVSLP